MLPFLPMLPVADPAQQPALRHRPADHPDRQRRRRATARPLPLGHRASSGASCSSSGRSAPCSTSSRSPSCSGLPRPAGAVPRRLVRRIPGHPDAGRSSPSAPVAALSTRSRPSRRCCSPAWRPSPSAPCCPQSPLAGALGFTALPTAFFLALAAMVVGYLVLIEIAQAAVLRLARNPCVARTRARARPRSPAAATGGPVQRARAAGVLSGRRRRRGTGSGRTVCVRTQLSFSTGRLPCCPHTAALARAARRTARSARRAARRAR